MYGSGLAKNAIGFCKAITVFHGLWTLLVVSIFVAYYPVWKGLVGAWAGTEEYAHGFLIIPICCYLLYGKREVITCLNDRPSNYGMAIVIGSLILYVVCHFAEILTGASLSMLMVWAGIVVYTRGFRTLKECFFVFFILTFMIPIPDQIYASLTIPLQLFVSKVSVMAVNPLHLPVYREGNLIHLPDRTFHVVTACSGLRSLVSLFMLGALVSYFNIRSNCLRAVLFLSAIPTAILANIFRISLMIVVYTCCRIDLTNGRLHTLLGLLVFFSALGMMLAFQRALSLWDKPIQENSYS